MAPRIAPQQQAGARQDQHQATCRAGTLLVHRPCCRGQNARLLHPGVPPTRPRWASRGLLTPLLAYLAASALATGAAITASAVSSTAAAAAYTAGPHHSNLYHRASAMGVTSCWLPGRLPLRPTDDANGPLVTTPVMLHVMLSTCHVPPPPLRGPSAAAASGGRGRTRLRVRGFVCVTREPQEDRCPTCHSYCLHNPFAAAMKAAAANEAATGARAGAVEAGAAGGEEEADSSDDSLPNPQLPLFRLRSPHTGRVYALALSDEEAGLGQTGTPEDGGGLHGELELDDADATWQEFELHVAGFPFYCLMLPYAHPGPRQHESQHLQHQRPRFPLGAPSEGVGTVCGSPSAPPHTSAAATGAAAAAARPRAQPSSVPPANAQPPAYFVLAPRHGLSPDALAAVLVPHVAWHTQLGFTQYLLYTEEPPGRLAAQPALRALLAARVLVLVLWDLTPAFSGSLPVHEALKRERPGSLRRAYWHQMRTYDHALLTHWHEAGAVMAFADLDEYLITPRPTTVADLFRTCGHQPGKGRGENKDTPGSDPPLGALRLPRMDGACSTCLHTVTGANTEPQHWAAWWVRHAATAALEALAAAAAAAAAASQTAAPASRSAAAALANRSGAVGTSQLLGWAHPMAAYDIWGKSDLPDMWDQKSIVLTEAAGFTSVHSPFVYPGFGAYGPIYEEAEVPGACAVWLHITNQAKVRIEALPFKSALPPGYSWPLERIAAAAGGGATAGPQLGRQGRSAAEEVRLLGREGERAGLRGGSGRVGGGRRLQAWQKYRG